MSKAITSKNPLKATIVALLKKKSGAKRVTCVRQDKDENGNIIYTGSCMNYDPRRRMYDFGKGFSVTADEVQAAL